MKPAPRPQKLSPRKPATAELGVSALKASAKDYAAAAHAPATTRAYRSDWAAFCDWCSFQELQTLPADPGTVALYLTALAQSGRRVSTIERALSAISQAHHAAGLPSPRKDSGVQRLRKGLRRRLGVAPLQKAPFLPPDLRTAFTELPAGLAGIRDRALLTLGFAGAFRRSELVSLNAEDLRFTNEGIEVHLRRSKTDQESQGHKLGIPPGGRKATCPVRLTQAWLDASGITHGPLFRAISRHGHLGSRRLSDRAVALIVQRTAELGGLKPEAFGGHSLRAGLVTAAAKAGKSAHSIMKQTRHRSLATVARYIRSTQIFDENAAEGVGL